MNIGKGLCRIAAIGALAGGLALGADTYAGTLAPVTHNVPPLVGKATFLGHHNPTARLTISVVLPFSNPGGLVHFLHDVQDRSSPAYHQFLTSAQFAVLYRPAPDQISAVVTFLQQHGVANVRVSPNGTRIHGTATVAALESAFGVAINDYSYNGIRFYSASTDPSLPSGIKVTAVLGLENAVRLKPHSVQNLHPQPMGAGLAPAGYSPGQIAAAYDWPDITTTATGAGVTIAVATAFNFRPLDLAKFWQHYNLPLHNVTNGNPVTITAIDGTTNVLNSETTLDIERSGSMAPGAAIHVYEAVNPQFTTFDDEFQQIATDDSVDVVTTSWGAPEGVTPLSSIQAEHMSFQQLASEGIPVMAASGDNGAADGASGNDNADFPSSDPYVIAAGGTSFPDLSDLTTEVAWGDGNPLHGAGGADSVLFAEPSYQTTTPGWSSNTACADDETAAFPDDTIDTPNEAGGGCTGTGAPSRQSSDIAMDADPATGYAIYYNGRWEVFGGTSFVAPELAGLFADLTQQEGGDLGPGPRLVYCVATDPTPVATPLFNDIQSGSNGFPAVAGWDHPTGFGTPDVNNFIADARANCL